MLEGIFIDGRRVSGFGLGADVTTEPPGCTVVVREGLSTTGAFAIATGSTLVGGLLVWAATKMIDGKRRR